MCFTGGVSDEVGLNKEGVVVHDMGDFNRRLVSSILVTEVSAIRSTILNKKRKREVAATVQEINKVDHEKIQAKAARIVSEIARGEFKPEDKYKDEVIEDSEPPRTFLSSDRHSSMTPEDLSERWGLSLKQAELTLKASTQKLTRSALMPLSRRYRADRMFEILRIHGTMATDTMDAR